MARVALRPQVPRLLRNSVWSSWITPWVRFANCGYERGQNRQALRSGSAAGPRRRVGPKSLRPKPSARRRHSGFGASATARPYTDVPWPSRSKASGQVPAMPDHGRDPDESGQAARATFLCGPQDRRTLPASAGRISEMRWSVNEFFRSRAECRAAVDSAGTTRNVPGPANPDPSGSRPCPITGETPVAQDEHSAPVFGNKVSDLRDNFTI